VAREVVTLSPRRYACRRSRPCAYALLPCCTNVACRQRSRYLHVGVYARRYGPATNGIRHGRMFGVHGGPAKHSVARRSEAQRRAWHATRGRLKRRHASLFSEQRSCRAAVRERREATRRAAGGCGVWCIACRHAGEGNTY